MTGPNGTRGDLPPGWAWATLDELGKWTGGGTPSKNNRAFWENGTIPWISAKDMKADYVGADADRITAAAVSNSAAKLIDEGSILCVVRSGILRHTFPVSIADRQVTINQDLRALSPYPDVSARYLQLYLRSQNGRILREYAKDGTTVSSIDPGKLGRILCPIAPRAEQRRIVAKVEELFGEIEAGEQELAKAREGLAAYRRAVLKAAVAGELTREWREKNPPTETGEDLLKRILVERRSAWEHAEFMKADPTGQQRTNRRAQSRYIEPVAPTSSDPFELPDGWAWASVDQVAVRMQYGTSAKCSNDNGGIPVLRMGNIQEGRLDFASLKYLPHGHADISNLLLDAGDVLFNRTNSEELVGKSAVYDGSLSPCSFASYLIRIRLIGIQPNFLVYFLNSPFGRAWVASAKSQQVGQANVSGGKLKTLRVPLPPQREQEEIVRVVEAAFEAVRELESEEGAWEQGAKLRQSILTAAFSGKLVPQDPSDEPASVLRERLRAAKEAASSGGSRPGKRAKRVALPHPSPLRPSVAEREGG